jgi:hypothetical protein
MNLFLQRITNSPLSHDEKAYGLLQSGVLLFAYQGRCPIMLYLVDRRRITLHTFGPLHICCPLILQSMKWTKTGLVGGGGGGG